MSRLAPLSPARKPGALPPAEPDERAAVALGWASLGLGIAPVTMPGRTLELIGVEPTARNRALLVTLVGARELAAAAGILSIGRPRPARWLWGRVAGDALDLTLLGSALRSKPESPSRVIAAMGAVAAVTAADVLTALKLSRQSRKDDAKGEGEGPLDVRAAITVWRPREEVYGFWRDFGNLPSFMYHLESVETTGDRSFRWRARAPAGRTVEWDAEMVEDRPNELISWRSLPDSSVQNSGTVRFEPAPGGEGTEIHLELHYEPPGGPLGAAVAKLFGEEPSQQVKDDMRRFKQVAETGEVVRSEGTPEGQVASRVVRQRPAQAVAS